MPDIDEELIDDRNPVWLTTRGWFWIWFITAATYPSIVQVLTSVYAAPSAPPPVGYKPGWAHDAVEWIFWAAVMHACCGVLFLLAYVIVFPDDS